MTTYLYNVDCVWIPDFEIFRNCVNMKIEKRWEGKIDSAYMYVVSQSVDPNAFRGTGCISTETVNQTAIP